MKIICIVILLAFIILAFLFKEKIYSPIFLFPFSFLILYILQILRLYGLFDADNNSFLICTLGVFSFLIGCIIEKTFFSVNSYEVKTVNISYEVIKYKNCFLIFMLLSLVIITLYSKNSLGYLHTGGSLYDMRYNQQDSLHTSALISFLYTYIGVPIVYIELPVCIYIFFILGRKVIPFLGFITVFFWFIGNGARLPLVYVILNIMCVCLLFYPVLKKQKKITKIFIALLLVFIFLNILSVARKSGKNISSDSNTFVQGLYYYLGGSMINMGEKLNFISAHNSLWGIASIYGLVLPFSNLISIPMVGNADYLFDMIQNSIISISSMSNQPYNFGITGFLYLFADGKILGVIIISILLGLLSQFVYEKFIILNNLKYYVLYVFVMEGIMMFVLTNILSGISFVMAIIYWSIFAKSNKFVRNVKNENSNN